MLIPRLNKRHFVLVAIAAACALALAACGKGEKKAAPAATVEPPAVTQQARPVEPRPAPPADTPPKASADDAKIAKLKQAKKAAMEKAASPQKFKAEVALDHPPMKVTKSLALPAGSEHKVLSAGNGGTPAPLTKAEAASPNLEEYSVTVAATEHLQIPGPPGALKVWIGLSSKAPENQPGMTTQTKPLEAVGETAKVTPFALGVTVEPNESICEKIDPSGSEVAFKLIARSSGTFKVGATVALYHSADCTGAPIPKSTKEVAVEVTVCKLCIVMDRLTEIWAVVWKWALGLLAVVLGVFTVVMRNKLLKWFGLKSGDADK